MEASVKNDCIAILREELAPAMGCTEPIAIAYCAAVARKVLGRPAQKMKIEASGNIIKNVKSVFVPNTGGLRGIPAAAAAGMVAGDHEKQLEVISCVTKEQQEEIRRYLERTPIEVALSDSAFLFDILIDAYAEEDRVRVRIANYHTNVVQVEKNGETLYEIPIQAAREEGLTDKSFLTVENILEFAEEVPLEEIEPIISRQIAYNTRIAEEGLSGNWGANIGKVLLSTYGDRVEVRAKAMAAAGSDARMNGCSLPVVIVSGSGNQGLAASLPVIEYARELKVTKDKLYRALALSALLTVHLKSYIGRLSAYCGAVSAGCGSAGAIAYLYGGGYEAIAHTLVNSLAIVSGIVCDGAKASCAAKIASAVDAGILGYQMYQKGQQFYAGDGIVSKGVEKTIENIGLLAKEGMRETDREILEIMISRC